LWDFSVFGDLALMHNGGLSEEGDGITRRVPLGNCYFRYVIQGRYMLRNRVTATMFLGASEGSVS